MTQPPDDAALVARLPDRIKAARDRKADREALVLEYDTDYSPEADAKIRDASDKLMVAEAMLRADAIAAVPVFLTALEAKDRRIEALEAELRLIADAEFVDVMCDPGWAIRIARAALEPSDKGVGSGR